MKSKKATRSILKQDGNKMPAHSNAENATRGSVQRLDHKFVYAKFGIL